MSKLSQEKLEATQKLGARYRDECFIEQKSLFDGRKIWTSENFDELYGCYNEQPDSSDKSFDDKLKEQLLPASNDAKQLFAELYLLNLLVLRNVRPDTKLAKAQMVLDWCSPPRSIPEDLKSIVYQTGVLHGGQGYHQNRFRQFWYLIDFGREFSRWS